jgi:hypothetical protein
MTIVPDTKNWTWVLERTCPECGLDASNFPCRSVAGELRLSSEVWRPLLMRQDASARPAPTTWSTLEYGCHVRDVFRIFDGRLTQMLREDDPLFDNWDQDETALAGRYGEQAPGTVADEVETSGDALADRFDQVGPDEWSRPGRRSDGSSFTVDTLSRYLLHDIVHHLHDVAIGTGPGIGDGTGLGVQHGTDQGPR